MPRTKVWQRRKVKINHPTGKKKREEKRSAVSCSNYPPKVTLQKWEPLRLKNSLKKERKNCPPHNVNVLRFMNNLERS